ncbi:MAG: SCO family protein [Xanthobacteraceae bacterium]|nr:SCO family protein [Xanthobacteraceae bacterium]
MNRTILATCAVLSLGSAVLWEATNGLRAFTTETARRLEVLDSPKHIPDVELVDRTGRSIRLSDYVGEAVIVEFIYTRCPTICSSLGDSFNRMQRNIKPRGYKARLLSISFDPAHDTEDQLSEYARLHDADAAIWNLARPRLALELKSVLDAYGVVVLPDGAGGFIHNAALHVVGPNGSLTGIYDLDDDHAVLQALARASR